MYLKTLAALLFALTISVIVIVYYKGKYNTALSDHAATMARYNDALRVNADNARVLEKLAETRALDDKAVRDITEAATVINEAAQDIERNKSDLIQNDDTARDYFNTPVPDAIKRLYGG